MKERVIQILTDEIRKTDKLMIKLQNDINESNDMLQKRYLTSIFLDVQANKGMLERIKDIIQIL